MFDQSWFKSSIATLHRILFPSSKRNLRRGKAGRASYAMLEILEPRQLLSGDPITLNTPVFGTLNGSFHDYTLDLTQTTDLQISSMMPNGSIHWTLTRGEQVYSGNFDVLDRHIGLLDPGQYSLRISVNDPAPPMDDYSFSLSSRMPSMLNFGSVYNNLTNPIDESRQVNFEFSTNMSGRVYFDSITSSPSAKWNVVDLATGQVIHGSALRPIAEYISFVDFSADDYFLQLTSGHQYRLTIEGQQGAAYSFSMLDAGFASSSIQIDSPNPISLTPSSSMQILSLSTLDATTVNFSIEAFQSTDTSGQNGAGTYSLIDDFGNVLFTSDFAHASGSINLAEFSFYKLIVRGNLYPGSSGSTIFSLKAETVATDSTSPVGGPLALGASYNDVTFPLNSLREANFDFSLMSPTTLWFDSLKTSSSVQWQLINLTTGLPVSAVSVIGSNTTAGPISFASDDYQLNVAAGDYRLKVTGDAGAPYNFRLLDTNQVVTAPIDLALPTPVTLTPSSATEIYTFSISQARPVEFSIGNFATTDQSGFYGDGDYRLISPSGTVLATADFQHAISPVQLTELGTYKIIVRGNLHPGSNGSTSFNLIGDASTSSGPVGGPLSLETVYNNTTFPLNSLAEANFDFTLSQAKSLWFDALLSSSSVQWQIINQTTGLPMPVIPVRLAGGPQSNPVPFSDDDFQVNLPSGNYRLKVTGNAGAEYSFVLRDSSFGITPLTLDSPASISLSPSATVQFLQFSLMAPTTVSLDVANFSTAGVSPASVTGDYRLVSPSGVTLLTSDFKQSSGSLLLADAGIYTIILRGNLLTSTNNTTSLDFTVKDLSSIPEPLLLNTTATASISVVGEQKKFSFTLGYEDRLYFDSLSNNSNLIWQLSGPIGEITLPGSGVSTASFAFGDQYLGLLGPGTYTLTVSGGISGTGTVSFQLINVIDAPTLTLDSQIDRNLSPANSAQVYRFAATADDVMYFQSLGMTSTDSSGNHGHTKWTLLGPDELPVFNGTDITASPGRLQLPFTGNYTLIVAGDVQNNGTTDYSFKVIPVHDTTNQLFLNINTTGTVTTISQRKQYTLTLPTSAAILFDSQTDDTSIEWQLEGPGGPVIKPISGLSPSRFSDGDQDLGLLGAGSYRLTVTSGTTVPASFAFRLTVTANLPPSGTSNTLSGFEEQSLTLRASHFGFSDVNAYTEHSFKAVLISQVPARGVLKNNGVVISNGQFISVIDLSDGKVIYVPNANVSGIAADQFDFQVQDDGGTAHLGQDLDPVPKTITLNLVNSNDAPAGTPNIIALSQDDHYTFSVSSFGLTDPNDPIPNSLLAVKIRTLPGQGTLTLSGSPVSINQSISAADIELGNLVFTTAAKASGNAYGAFGFQVQDDGGTARGGVDLDPGVRTMAFRITPVNHAPIGTSKTVTTIEDRPYIIKDVDFGFTDPNDVTPNVFAMAIITSLPNAGAGILRFKGIPVKVGQSIRIADIISNGLVFSPAANANGAGYANFSFRVVDGGGVLNGGQNTDISPKTMTIDVASVNDAPSGTEKTVTMSANSPYTMQVADFGFVDAAVDVPANQLLAVKITTLPTGGTLKLNTVPVNAGQFVSALDISNGKLVYTPASNSSSASTASFTFQVQDDGGTSNSGIDLDPTPKTMVMMGINHAPVAASTTLTRFEVAHAGVGTNVYTFKRADFGFSDPDDITPNAFLKVKIISLPAIGSLSGVSGAGAFLSVGDIDKGLLQYSLGGSEHVNGLALTSFRFQVQDDGGTANGGNDISEPATITFNVTNVNSPPSGKSKQIPLGKGFTYTFTVDDFGFTDANDSPANSLLAIQIMPPSITKGSFTNNGVQLTANQFTSVSKSDIESGKLIFTPAQNASGSGFAPFSFRVQDDGGTANGGLDLDYAHTMSFSMITVNHAPKGTSKSIAVSTDTYTLTEQDFGFSDSDDIQPNAFAGVYILDSNLLQLRVGNAVRSVAANEFISIANIQLGNLFIRKSLISSSAGSSAFVRFKVRDSGGITNGGIDADPDAKTLTFS